MVEDTPRKVLRGPLLSDSLLLTVLFSWLEGSLFDYCFTDLWQVF